MTSSSWRSCCVLLWWLWWWTVSLCRFGLVGGTMSNDLVRVYDHVLDADTARRVHQLCLTWTNPNSVFVFPHPTTTTTTTTTVLPPLAHFLNQLLWQLYPDADPSVPLYFVEFWKRTSWEHILAHADMDEGWARSTDATTMPLKHPETGHVLYLQLGRQVQGPTVVWNVTKGGDFSETNEMIVVPAVEGRLLRFRGDALHAVPRPADIYWSHQPDTRGDGAADFQRSVLLFNTWKYEEGNIVGYEIFKGDQEETATGQTERPNKVSDWEPVQVSPITVDDSWSSWIVNTLMSPTTMFQIPLMGNARRRGTNEYIARLQAPTGTSEVFVETTRVTSVTVTSPRRSDGAAEF